MDPLFHYKYLISLIRVLKERPAGHGTNPELGAGAVSIREIIVLSHYLEAIYIHQDFSKRA